MDMIYFQLYLILPGGFFLNKVFFSFFSLSICIVVFDGELENWPPERINLLQDTRHGGEELRGKRMPVFGI